MEEVSPNPQTNVQFTYLIEEKLEKKWKYLTRDLDEDEEIDDKDFDNNLDNEDFDDDLDDEDFDDDNVDEDFDDDFEEEEEN